MAVLGLALGSFFNVLIHRLPRKESISFPPSHCASCGTKIKPWHNIPVISYILLRGKCKTCGDKIHWHHLLVELITPVLFLSISLKFDVSSLLFYKYLLLVFFLIPIFFIDAFHRLILHVTTIPLLVIGLVFSILPGSDVFIIEAVITGLIVFSVMLLLSWSYTKLKKAEGLGGGDIWLLTALATFFGALAMPWILIIACLIAILYYILMIRQKEQTFVFGPFIVLACLIWIFGAGSYILPYMMLPG